MRKSIAIVLVCVGMLALATLAAAQSAALKALKPADFPRRPIEMVVVYPAGGGMDVTARTLAQHAEKYLGTKLVVVNRTGGGGLVGHTWLAKSSPADGYTVGVVANTLYPDALLRGGQFVLEDFMPIASINFSPLFWIANTDTEVGKMSSKQVIDYIRKNGKGVNVGITPDNVFQFLTNDVERNLGVQVNMVPFQGGKPGVVALLGKQIDLTTCLIVEFSQYAEAGQVRAVAVADDRRHPKFPDTPTFSELGIPVGGNLWGIWRFLTVPPNTPKDRVRFLEAAFLEALQDPETQAAYEKLGDPLNPMNAADNQKAYVTARDTQVAFFKSIGKMR